MAKTKSGKHQARIMIDGVRHTKVVGSAKEAVEWKAELLRKHRQGALVAPTKMTVSEAFERWIEHLRTHIQDNGEKYKPKYIGRQKTNLEKLRRHPIAHVRLDKFTKKDVEAFKQALLNSDKANQPGKKLDPQTVKNTLVPLGTAMNYAKEQGWTGHNPVKEVTKPKKDKPFVAKYLDADQLRTLFEQTKSWRFHACIVLAGIHGLRSGEIRGLRWSDYDAEARTLSVLQNLSTDEDNKSTVIVRTKTPTSEEAIIPLSPTAFAALEHHRLQYERNKARWGNKIADHTLMFLNHRGGILKENTLREAFYDELKRIGMPKVDIHSLRHSCATIHANGGTPPAVLKAIMRHADDRTTNKYYVHSDKKSIRAALDRADVFDIEYDPAPVPESA